MNSLLTKPVDGWTAADLASLVEAQLPEGMRIDYKKELHLDSKAQKAEVAKDVSGLANAQGGWLFFGIDEDDSAEPLPTALTPLPATGLQTRLEDILDATLEPRARFHAATIQVGEGVVIVMKVEARTGSPIMVQGYGQNRYFMRSGTRTRPMSGTEVAEAHRQAQGRADELHEVLSQLPLKARVARNRSVDDLRLAADGVKVDPWLPLPTVVVAALHCRRPLIAPSAFTADAFPDRTDYIDGRSVRLPGRWSLGAFGAEQELMVNEAAAEGPPPHWTRTRIAVYRGGVIEWAHRYREAEFTIPALSFAQDVHNVLRYAATVFSEVGYFGAVATWVRIENAEKAQLNFPRSWDLEPHAPGVEWMGNYREASVDELLIDPTPTVREAMDLIWQGFGLPRCIYFDAQTGAWRD